MTSKERITLRLPQDLIDSIRKKAKEMGISVNAYITIALAKELKNSKK